MTAIVLFQSTQAATRAEAVLQRAGFDVHLAPVPRHLSSECTTGLSFEAHNGQAGRIEAALRSAAVPFVAIHPLEKQSAPAEKGGRNGP